jgi:putative tricarboxylic transport membrane protein
MASRRPHDLPGTLAAAAFIALGLVLMRQTGRMTPLGSVFPITISAAMIAFSALLIARNVVLGLRRAAHREPDTPEMPATPGSTPRRLAFLAAMGAWVLLLPVLGFFAASVAGFFAVMAVAIHERLGVREGVLLAVFGLAIIAGFTLLMSEVLLIPLPRSRLF